MNNHREEKQNIWLSENDVIEILTSLDEKSKTRINYTFSQIKVDFDLQEIMEYKGFYLAKNILRAELGFEKDKKPGDFDIIIIPYKKTRIFFERTIVCEVKIVRPTRRKPSKNANSLGITQIKGLIEDGFPLISLIHVIMTEPLLDEEKMDVKLSTVPANSSSDDKIDFDNLEKYFIDAKRDHFGWVATDNQMRRLITSELPKYIATQCFSLEIDVRNKISLSTPSRSLRDFESGYFNPNLKNETIEKVRNHFNNFPNRYQKQER